MLALALACGGLCASRVSGRIRSVEAMTGRPVPVLVAARPVRPDARLRPGDLAVRRVPARYAPVDVLPAAADAEGARVPAGFARGAYVTASALGDRVRGRGGGLALRRGERAVEIPVSGGAPLAAAGSGTRVDVLVSTEPRDGAGRSFVALEDVELLALGGAAPSGDEGSANGDDGGGRAAATATATLRVTLRQAVYLTAAQNFAREVRLLPRPPGDRGGAGRSTVSAGGL